VTFDQMVTLPSNPATTFQLRRQSDNATVALSAAINNSGPTTVVNFTFTGGAIDKSSLADGRYTLTIPAGAVSTPSGLLDGNGDGIPGDNYTLIGNTSTNNLFRLFGDADGDGDVDNSDFVYFRAA